MILAALYLLWAYQRVFHGPVTEANGASASCRWTEGLVIAPLLALIVFLGVYPTPMLERIEPSVKALVAHVDEQVDELHRTVEHRLRRRRPRQSASPATAGRRAR